MWRVDEIDYNLWSARHTDGRITATEWDSEAEAQEWCNRQNEREGGGLSSVDDRFRRMCGE